MELLYIAALVFGAGALAVQLFMGGDSDHGGAGGHDAPHGDGHAGGDDAHGVLASAALIVLSLRFWVFAAFAFGLTGTLIRMLGLASPLFTLVLATVAGLAAGALAGWVFRALARAESTSSASGDDLIGQLGRVLIAVSATQNGKVRLQLRGQAIDVLATTDEGPIGAGEVVLVEAVHDHTVQVARAPAELLIEPASGDAPRLPGA
jgi:membrane protein implicated in regulation of membrane protease activity